MEQLNTISNADQHFLPFQGLYLNGSLLFLKKITNGAVSESDHSILSPTPTGAGCHFLPHGCQQAFSLLSSIKTLQVLWALLSRLQIGFIYIGSKCDKTQTNNYPHGPDAAPLVTQMKKA